jgi:hypothetical protein
MVLTSGWLMLPSPENHFSCITVTTETHSVILNGFFTAVPADLKKSRCLQWCLKYWMMFRFKPSTSETASRSAEFPILCVLVPTVARPGYEVEHFHLLRVWRTFSLSGAVFSPTVFLKRLFLPLCTRVLTSGFESDSCDTRFICKAASTVWFGVYRCWEQLRMRVCWSKER